MSTITGIITNAEHDGWVKTPGSTINTLNDFTMGYSLGGEDWSDGYFMFSNIDIPKNSRINSAYIRFVATAVNGFRGPVNMSIYGRKDDSPTVPSNKSGVFENPTLSHTDWVLDVEIENLQSFLTPNLSGIVQELVNLTDWNAGNRMLFVFESDKDESNGQISVYTSGNFTPLEYVPYITIDFTAPVTSQINSSRNIQNGSCVTYVNKFGNFSKTETSESGKNFDYLMDRFNNTQYYGS